MSDSAAQGVIEKDPLPGDLAIWFVIMAEMLVFGVFFIVYVVVRSSNVELFNEYQLELHRMGGVINTIVLITSSRLDNSAEASLIAQGG